VTISEEQLAHHIPQKVDYAMGQLYADLLQFAHSRLPPEGRLAFWVPVVREDYVRKGVECLPK